MTRPGDRLRACAARLFDAGTMERVIDPAIADLQCEPASVTGYIAVLKVSAMCGWREVAMATQDWTAGDRRAVKRTLIAAAGITLISTLALEQPFVSHFWRPGLNRWVPVYLAPQGVPIAVTIGVALGVLFGLEGHDVSRRLNRWLLLVAAAASAVSFVDLAWITPAANRAFRVAMSGNSGLTWGAPELTLGELWQFSSADYAFNFHTRVALAFAPLILALFVLSLARAKVARRWVTGVTVIIAFVAYYVLLYGGRSLALVGSVPAYAGAWFPNVVFVLVAGSLAIVSARRQAGRRSPAAS
jgi:hypothetical protein